MRQRTIDVNQTTLFVDTQPRPVNRAGTPKRPLHADDQPHGPGRPNGGGGVGGRGEQMTERRAWYLLAAALALLLAGAYLVRGNHYAHLHRQIHDAYAKNLLEWDRDVRAAFAATSWELHVPGLEQPLPLRLRALPIKRALRPKNATLADAAAFTSDSSEALAYLSAEDRDEASRPAQGAGANPVRSGPAGPGAGTAAPGAAAGGQERRKQGRGRAARASSSLLEFRLERLMEAVYPTHVPVLDRHSAGHSRMWRPVVPELRRPTAMWLRANDTRTGAVSVVELGPVAFARETTVAGGGQGRCVYEEVGVWQEDGTCSVQEYLWGLCIKVSQNATTGAWAADASTGGGPGCGPEWGWELGQWRRLDERRSSIHGRLYLPVSASNSTVVTVRHARDPAILESDMVRRLAPNVEQQILLHAIGLAMCFLGLVLLLSVGAFAAPALLHRARVVWDTVRSGRRRHRRGRGARDCFGHGDSAVDKGSDDDEL